MITYIYKHGHDQRSSKELQYYENIEEDPRNNQISVVFSERYSWTCQKYHALRLHISQVCKTWFIQGVASRQSNTLGNTGKFIHYDAVNVQGF